MKEYHGVLQYLVYNYAVVSRAFGGFLEFGFLHGNLALQVLYPTSHLGASGKIESQVLHSATEKRQYKASELNSVFLEEVIIVIAHYGLLVQNF